MRTSANPANLSFSQLQFSVSTEDEQRLRALGLAPPNQVTPGTRVEIKMLVSNAGDAGTTELAVKINDAVAQIQSYAIPGKGALEVSFFFTPPADGTYRIELVDEAEEVTTKLEGTITTSTPLTPANIVAGSTLAITPLEVSSGKEVTLRFDLTNLGEVTGTETFILLLNGVEVARQAITVVELSGESLTFTITAPDVAGNYIATITDAAGKLLPPTANFLVKTIPPPTVADIRILNITTTVPREVEPGQRVTIVIPLQNVGKAGGDRILILQVDGGEIDRQTVTLGAGATTSVEFTFNAPPLPPNLDSQSHTLDVAGFSQTFTVRRKIVPPVFNLIPRLNISPSSVDPGQPVTIRATLRNSGGEAGTTDVILRINGEVEETKRAVAVSGLSDATVVFNVTRTEPGTYTVQIEVEKGVDVRIADGTFTVTKPGVALVGLVPASFSVGPTTVDVGQSVTVTVDVTNTGDIPGDITVTLRLDGAIKESKVERVGPGETRLVTFTILEQAAGTHTVQVNDLPEITFEVSEVSLLGPLPAPERIPATIAFMIIFGLLVAGLSYLLYARAARLRPPPSAV